MLWEGFPGHPLRKDYVTYDQSIVNTAPGAPGAIEGSDSESFGGDE
jgi:NADH:ubiquinone oxidoreductase subunit C